MPSLHPRLSEHARLKRCDFPACGAACCLYGAWVDLVEIDDILANAARIAPHLRAGQRDPAGWFTDEAEADEHALSGQVRHTSVLPDEAHYGGTACVFLRDDHKCALQVAGEASGEHPWRFKPFYCILHPLMLDEQGRITLDESEALAREPASCLRPADEAVQISTLFRDELDHLLGKSIR
jgi:Fe-S-cluster containining protein